MKVFETIRINKEIPLPYKKRETDAGLDIYALESKFIFPLTTTKIFSNHKIDIKDNLFGLIQSRSGIRSKGLIIDGVIDETYQGNISLIISNVGLMPRYIKKGERIAQIIFLDYNKVFLEEKETFSRITDRGENGFGSSGSQ